MRGAGNGCFSGECGECDIELEAVVDNLGGLTTECYPMGGEQIEFDTFDYDEFFGSESDENKEKP